MASTRLPVALDALEHCADQLVVGQARRYAPHIIFLDRDMPVLDGYGCARAIRDASTLITRSPLR